MDWRTRIAAIVLAGGSVTGCASAADPGDAGLPDPAPGSTIEPAEPVVAPTPVPNVKLRPISTEQQPLKPRVRIPVCNANPDPCCRFPDSPECRLPE
jgi:hypothetical protein